MPASLYNLANRKHFADSSAVTNVAEEISTPVPAVESEVKIVDVPLAVAIETTIDEANKTELQEENIVEEKVDNNVPNWDASWSKTQLLAVAQSLNLSVTSTSTKTEIVNALTAATKAQ